MKTPEQVAAGVYKNILLIIIVLLLISGVSSTFNVDYRGLSISDLTAKFYLLGIPAAMMAITILMLIRGEKNLALAGGFISLMWIVFRWIG